ncbi:hypothetical protein QCA50_016012 [Cerrena zonata]|uniref:Uncharacterized protein n=1 Tax=Cerrena zonata TaxID=2478898 RepID=A0AAW0FPK3_9APHY
MKLFIGDQPCKFIGVFGEFLQNGPFKPNDDINTISQKSEEQGVNSIYNISTGVDSMSIDDHENLIIEDAITSSDDDFDYFKYSQQKAAIVIGDLIGLGLISKSDIDVPYHNIIKRRQYVKL